MRDKVLHKKIALANDPKFATSYINPDEPLEVRRTKGLFRTIAAKAREDGHNVRYRGEWIGIGDVTYSALKVPSPFHVKTSDGTTEG